MRKFCMTTFMLVLLVGAALGLAGCNDGSDKIEAAATKVYDSAVAYCDSQSAPQATNNKPRTNNDQGTRKGVDLLDSLREYHVAFNKASISGKRGSYLPSAMYDQVRATCPQAKTLVDDFLSMIKEG